MTNEAMTSLHFEALISQSSRPMINNPIGVETPNPFYVRRRLARMQNPIKSSKGKCTLALPLRQSLKYK